MIHFLISEMVNAVGRYDIQSFMDEFVDWTSKDYDATNATDDCLMITIKCYNRAILLSNRVMGTHLIRGFVCLH